MISVSSSVLGTAIQTMLKVASTNISTHRDISMILRADPHSGETKGYLGAAGWGFSASAIYSLGAVSSGLEEEFAASFPVAAWKGIAALLPKGKKEGIVQIVPGAGEEGPTIAVMSPAGVEITFTGSDVVYAGLAPENYATPAPDSQILVPTDTLRYAFTNALAAVARGDEHRPILNRIQLTWADGELRMYASDGRRMSRVILSGVAVPPRLQEKCSGPDQYLSAVHYTVATLFQGLKGLADVTIITPEHPYTNNSMNSGALSSMQTLVCGPVMLAWSNEGYFPMLERAVPEESNITGGFILVRKDILPVLDTVTSLWKQGSPRKSENRDACVRVSQAGDMLEVSLHEYGMTPMKVPAAFFGNSEYPVFFNAEYLRQWVSVQSSDKVIVWLQTPSKAARITCDRVLDNQYVLMPVLPR